MFSLSHQTLLPLSKISGRRWIQSLPSLALPSDTELTYCRQASIRKTKSGRERKAVYEDIKELRKEFKVREKKCVGTLIGSSKVVLATLHGAGGFQMKDEIFDVVIIDEASQALEAQCWVPLLTMSKLILAGDHLQLP